MQFSQDQSRSKPSLSYKNCLAAPQDSRKQLKAKAAKIKSKPKASPYSQVKAPTDSPVKAPPCAASDVCVMSSASGLQTSLHADKLEPPSWKSSLSSCREQSLVSLTHVQDSSHTLPPSYAYTHAQTSSDCRKAQATLSPSRRHVLSSLQSPWSCGANKPAAHLQTPAACSASSGINTHSLTHTSDHRVQIRQMDRLQGCTN